jgi:membrane protein
MVLGFAFLLLVSLVLTTAISAVSEQVLPGDLSSAALTGINTAISFVVATVVFAAIYKVLPDADVAWKDVWVGASLTAVLFTNGA